MIINGVKFNLSYCIVMFFSDSFICGSVSPPSCSWHVTLRIRFLSIYTLIFVSFLFSVWRHHPPRQVKDHLLMLFVTNKMGKKESSAVLWSYSGVSRVYFRHGFLFSCPQFMFPSRNQLVVICVNSCERSHSVVRGLFDLLDEFLHVGCYCSCFHMSNVNLEQSDELTAIYRPCSVTESS